MRLTRSAMTRARTHTRTRTRECHGLLVCLPAAALPCERTAPAYLILPSSSAAYLRRAHASAVTGSLYTSRSLVILLADRLPFTSLSHSNCGLLPLSLEPTLFVLVALYRFSSFLVVYLSHFFLAFAFLFSLSSF